MEESHLYILAALISIIIYHRIVMEHQSYLHRTMRTTWLDVHYGKLWLFDSAFPPTVCVRSARWLMDSVLSTCVRRRLSVIRRASSLDEQTTSQAQQRSSNAELLENYQSDEENNKQ